MAAASGNLRALIEAAFGPSACDAYNLYHEVLRCPRTATPSALRKAYHQRALAFHPDKQPPGAEALARETATHKFQAVSAAYQWLSDASNRVVYDAMGSLGDDEDCGNETQDVGAAERGGRKTTKHHRDWIRFFRSVFRDMASAGEEYGPSYRGSDLERAQVLEHYATCKGDLRKVMACIVGSQPTDLARWRKEILEPAMARGEAERYDHGHDEETAERRTKPGAVDGPKRKKWKRPTRAAEAETRNTADPLADSGDSSSDDDEVVGRKKLRKRGNGANRNQRIRKRRKRRVFDDDDDDDDGLLDTDDDDDDETEEAGVPDDPPRNVRSSRATTMSRRDKMEFRVAKKRKERTEKELEVAKLMRSKDWTGGATHHGRRQGSNPHHFGDAFFSSLERKFAAPPSKKAGTNRRTTKRTTGTTHRRRRKPSR